MTSKTKKRWVQTRNSDFFEFSSRLNGRRVKMYSSDPDIQLRAFVDGRRLHLVMNNLWTEQSSLNMQIPPAERRELRT